LATVSFTRQAISQNSATDEGLRIQGSLLSVIFDGGTGGRLRRSLSILKRNDHSSLSLWTGMRYWGNATEEN
jgi:hypothetical protein